MRGRPPGRAARALALVGTALLAAGILPLATWGTTGGGFALGPCGSEPAGDAGDILACVRASIAYVETPLGSGSAVLVGDGRLVTNAHVVDPYREVDVVLDGERIEGVAVAGVDALADIAVLGPIATDLAPAVLVDAAAVRSLAIGGDVYLVGYPGEVDEAPEPAISRGILSRRRAAERFDQTYLQTDASIGGGQSGGALVDGVGRVLGISGLNFAEQFALALTAPDVARSIERIDAGESPPYHALPEAGGVRVGEVVANAYPRPGMLVVPPARTDRSVSVGVPADDTFFAEVYDMWGEPLAYAGSTPDELGDIMGDLAAPPEDQRPGTIEFDLEPDTFAVIVFYSDDPGGAVVPFRSSTPVVEVVEDDRDRHATIAVGDRVVGAVDLFDGVDTYAIDLDEGEVIEVYAGSPTGDMAFTIRAPEESYEDGYFADDSDEGLYGLDAVDTFEATDRGRYLIDVQSFDGIVIGYVLEVAAA